MNLEKRIAAFGELGKGLINIVHGKTEIEFEGKDLSQQATELYKLIQTSQNYNGWFTKNFVQYMIDAIGNSLQKDKLEQWIQPYQDKLRKINAPKTIGVVMAGNVPAVGFHDLLCVLISGNRLLAKLSGDDNRLIPAIVNMLNAIEPGFEGMCSFTENRLSEFKAVIATGSNNTARYFEYYFGKFNHIIRKNRNGVAVLTGSESEKDLNGLCSDIFTYYGLGCRNVSKLLLPAGYDFTSLLDVISKQENVNDNHKYFNNYEYNKAIYLVNGTPHFDSGNLLLVEDEQIASPVSVVNYQFYNDESELPEYAKANAAEIQCLISNSQILKNRIQFGKSQQPELWDYADGVDTLSFLLSLD